MRGRRLEARRRVSLGIHAKARTPCPLVHYSTPFRSPWPPRCGLCSHAGYADCSASPQMPLPQAPPALPFPIAYAHGSLLEQCWPCKVRPSNHHRLSHFRCLTFHLGARLPIHHSCLITLCPSRTDFLILPQHTEPAPQWMLLSLPLLHHA